MGGEVLERDRGAGRARTRLNRRRDRPPSAERGRRPARHVAARGGARGTIRQSTRRSRGRRSAGRGPRRREARRELRGRGRSAQARSRTAAFPLEKPRAKSSPRSPRRPSLSSETRGRDPTGVPSRSTKRLRIANAEWSETCCAVIEVTRLSNGSGESGGRNPASRGTISARTGWDDAQAMKGVEVEREPEEPLDHRPGQVVERLDVDPARGGRSDLAPADSAVESAVEPEVREVGPEHPEALGRELEVVRLRKAQQQRRRGSRTARTGGLPARALCEPAAREDAVGGERGAMIGDAVADVDERPARRGARGACTCRRRPGMGPSSRKRTRHPSGCGSAPLQRNSRSRPSRSSTGAISCGRPLETMTGR